MTMKTRDLSLLGENFLLYTLIFLEKRQQVAMSRFWATIIGATGIF